jgi:ArsR family transcriptional regulator
MNKDEVCELVQIDLTRVRKIRAALVAAEAVQGLADTFSALGDPTRVRMLDALSHGELCVCDLAAVLGLSQSAVSHQLRLLRNIRLVRPRRDGRVVFYSLDDQHIMSIFKQTLQHVEEEQRQPSAFAKASTFAKATADKTADKASRVRRARAR